MFCAVLSSGPASIKTHGHKRVHVQCRTLMWACKHQNTRSQTRACSVPYSHVGLQASKHTVTNACMFCAVLSCGPASIKTHGHKRVHVLCRTLMWACKHRNTRSQMRACSVPQTHHMVPTSFFSDRHGNTAACQWNVKSAFSMYMLHLYCQLLQVHMVPLILHAGRSEYLAAHCQAHLCVRRCACRNIGGVCVWYVCVCVRVCVCVCVCVCEHRVLTVSCAQSTYCVHV